MAGISDVFGRLSLALALWNGKDPILKERMFGLTNSEGNHGEDVKEYWWYLDAVPSSAWLKWRYHYPQAAFPYERADRRERPPVEARPGVRAARHRHLRRGPLLDRRGRLREGRSDRHPDAGHGPQRGPGGGDAPRAADALVPQRRGRGTRRVPGRPCEAADGGSRIRAVAPGAGRLHAPRGPGPDGAPAELLFCENETNAPRIYGSPATTPWPKDGINDHVVERGRDRQPGPDGHQGGRVVPARGPGRASTPRSALRLPACGAGRCRRRAVDPAALLGAGFTATHGDARGRGRRVLRRARPAGRHRRGGARSCARRSPGCCGASSTTPTTSSAGSTATRARPRPPAERLTGRNAGWRHFDAADILSMPDPWEYPWFAAWDLAFHADHPGPRRPGVREVPAAGHVPRVVPAPERRAARLRVVVRRRQPAGPRDGRAAGLGDRRAPGHGVPGADLPQAAA